MIIVAATNNRHKLEEIGAITASFDMELLSRKEAGADGFEIEEDGTTFEENSLKKAKTIMEVSGKPSLADDSGLAVDFLDGAPGVYSARFAGEDGNDAKNNAKLLDLMKDVPEEQRGAAFVSVITLVFPDGETLVARGECRGRILYELQGENGFGYDPLFVPEGFDKSFGELSAEEKNRISHRARALAELERQLKERLGKETDR